MITKQIFRSRVLVSVVICSFIVLFLPVGGAGQAAQRTGAMVGFVYSDHVGTPVESAVVKIRHVENGREFQSTATDKTGYYEIAGIPEGRYLLGVTAGGEDYNFEFNVYIKADERAQLSLALKKGGSAVVGLSKDKAFFATPVGIAILALLGAGLTVGTIALVSGEDAVVSPSRR